ncbi:MAG: exodeoxyribonuclease VII large subunit [Gammaproteobacteria bacterium]|nr:exodeoxyribonuclease VII large subunit [Gammaproteobacteria bacterium]
MDIVPQKKIFTVSQLNCSVRLLIEGEFPSIWVSGEISNLARPSSGHLYFTLKDADAQVRCAMFKGRNQLLRANPAHGMQVLVRGRISLYEPRGDYQLIVEHMEEAGDGALRRAFEELKARLATEGLFAADTKRPLPALPRQIGLITSPTGAVIQDMLTILRRRFPAIPVVLYPVPVQGKGAARDIARMIDLAGSRQECDVLILARGGGSLEDLWAFNEEAVARAIQRCPLPLVSAVGHETDVTIADFVADLRAPTPSGAAELVVPDRHSWLQTLTQIEHRLSRQIRHHLAGSAQRQRWLLGRLQRQHPGHRLQAQMQHLDQLEARMVRSLQQTLRQRLAQLNTTAAGLQRHNPQHRIDNYHDRFSALQRQLTLLVGQQLRTRRHQLSALGRALDAISPLATLGRGYAIVRTLPQRQIVRQAHTLHIGAAVETQLAEGRFISTVTATHES